MTDQSELFNDWEARFKYQETLNKKQEKVIAELSKELCFYYELYHQANRLLGYIGMEGEIDSQHLRVECLSDALFNIDGGVYDGKLGVK